MFQIYQMMKQESLANAKVYRATALHVKTDFDVKLALKVILDHLFCNQLQVAYRHIILLVLSRMLPKK